ncbi:hypothetical protein FRZ44_10800 [Hypericibacter terrae]|uniref:Uncharacterized protein n=1 Tax=Hypericibacter terrae TaxID=2602015 RepID=A0A5J6MEB1_9PROT|nr:glycosyltransferase family 39 protein [Hypericibacter terrae]QEX15793.1 hypothetical protein FRZ44_10800 [Hypericibacter terrae]
MSEAVTPVSALPHPAGVSGRIALRARLLLVGALAFALGLKLVLIFRININWDEFYYLSFVQDYLRGSVSDRFQTIHVHFFSWLPAVAESEIGQILIARAVMACCAIGSALLLLGIARRFLSREAALFGVLGYLSTTAVIEHGTSFRTDSIATLLVLLSLFLVLRKPGGPRGAAFAGVALAVAMLVTIKTAFYVALIGPVIWCLGAGSRDRVRLALAFGLSFGLVLGGLYMLHVFSLAQPAIGGATGYLRGTAAKVFLEDGPMPRWPELLVDIAQNPLYWFLAVQGAVIAWRAARARDTDGGWERWLPLLLAVPILTPLIYRNAFAYYYAFILPPAAILVGLVYDRIRQSASDARQLRSLRLLALLIVFQIGILLLRTTANLPDAIGPQRGTLDVVHAVFPEPVPYIDGYGVVSGFPRAGFFMSSWGVDKYRDAGEPVFRDLVAKAQPPLLLADSPSLYGALVPGVTVVPERALLPEDVAFLQANYLQHWGMIFVAGKDLDLPVSGDATEFEIAIGGDYRLESDAPLLIDGIMRRPGDVVTLAIGIHSIDADPGTIHVNLRWAAALPPPPGEPTDLWTFFSASQ